jgi:hypothetical protein
MSRYEITEEQREQIRTTGRMTLTPYESRTKQRGLLDVERQLFESGTRDIRGAEPLKIPVR